jgi:choline dehydrogenase-like flavoprotein
MPFVDIRTLPADSTIETDVCVIGSGPAGLAIATELATSRLKTALVESGDLSFDVATQALAAGTSIGVSYPDLSAVRQRFFGGTSNHWGGNVRMLDEQDFKERPWVPNSGWPFAAAVLAPYYARAATFCGFPDTAFDHDYWSREKRSRAWEFADRAVVSRVFHTVGAPHLRFGTSYREALRNALNVDVYLNANVTSIETEQNGKAVSRLGIQTLDGQSYGAKARVYVLAAGGIENARLLLLSPSPSTGTLGNGHDLVGRFFMEHLTVPEFCRFYPTDPDLPISYYRSLSREWGDIWGILSISERLQQEARIPNFRFQLTNVTNAFNENMSAAGMQSLRTIVGGLRNGSDNEDLGWHLANIIADIDEVAGAAYQRAVNHPDYPLVHIDVVAIGEQIPNPNSRVMLGDRLDAFGQRQAVLDWRLTEQDSESIRQSAAILARELGRSGLGRLTERFPPGVFAEVAPRPHIHHMGTTRMHADPAHGVVDADCRVHGVDNFYVAGSSVFPTVGNVNPTYTIIALAIRLSDHIRQKLA